MKYRKLYLLTFLVFTALLLQAQVPTVAHFHGVANKNTAIINWTILKGPYTCAGVELQWSTDSLYGYTSIYTDYSVCGNPNTDEEKNTIHQSPDIHKKNFYRLFLPPFTYSQIIVVDFTKENGAYQLFPHPFSNQARLEFENPNGEACILEIAHPKGYLLYRFEYINTNYFYLYKGWFTESNLFYFRIYPISGNFKPIRGKFITF